MRNFLMTYKDPIVAVLILAALSVAIWSQHAPYSPVIEVMTQAPTIQGICGPTDPIRC